MRAKTAIQGAVYQFNAALATYARANGANVRPVNPHVFWKPGEGWEIDGTLWKHPAEYIVVQYDDAARTWLLRADHESEPAPKSSEPAADAERPPEAENLPVNLSGE